MALSNEQQAFLQHDPRKHGRLLAGPGTGKSFTCVAYLEQSGDIRAQMVTFTRAATAEFAKKMQDADLKGLSAYSPATIHSLALRLLMQHGSRSVPMPLRIPDSWEVKTLLRPHLSRRLKQMGYADAIPTLIDRLEREMAARWESLDPDRILISELDPNLRNAYIGLWEQHRRVFGYVLLGELPLRAGHVLEDIVEGKPIDLDVLLVDEYQDLNRADIKLVKLIGDSGIGIVAIGDDDQSIYGYRMAAPEGIRNFLDEFNTVHDYPLTESRRCGGEILNAANDLIASEPGRPAKSRLKAVGGAQGAFEHVRFDTDAEEMAGVARLVATRIRDGVAPGDIAILVRSSADKWAKALTPELAARGVELASSDWVDEVLNEEPVRRVLSLAHLACNRADSLAWWNTSRSYARHWSSIH